MADPLRFTVEVTPQAAQQIGDQAGPILRAMAAGVVGEMKRLMSLPKSGRAYRRGRRAIHVASAPGEAPAIDTGNLAGSINFGMQSPTMAEVTVNAEYAAYLEFGTIRMAARPYVEPALEKVRDQFRGILGQARINRPI
jgi:HK97 gp10 family phage protein